MSECIVDGGCSGVADTCIAGKCKCGRNLACFDSETGLHGITVLDNVIWTKVDIALLELHLRYQNYMSAIGYINLFQTILFYRTYFDKARLSLIPKLGRPFNSISWRVLSGSYHIAETLSSWKKRNRGNRETYTVKTIQWNTVSMKLFKKHSILAITISKVDGHRNIFDEERCKCRGVFLLIKVWINMDIYVCTCWMILLIYMFLFK